MIHSSKIQDVLTRPKRPKIQSTFIGAFGITIRILASPLLALAIAIAVWIFPNGRIRVVLESLLLIVTASAALMVIAYLFRWRDYIIGLEKLLANLRIAVLGSANIDDTEESALTYQIISLENSAGTVSLVVHVPHGSGLRAGSRLAATITATGEIWGVVEVTTLDNVRARAKPVNRLNAAFWEVLEDRMLSDPTPPPGMHLEPAIEGQLASLLGSIGTTGDNSQ